MGKRLWGQDRSRETREGAAEIVQEGDDGQRLGREGSGQILDRFEGEDESISR